MRWLLFTLLFFLLQSFIVNEDAAHDVSNCIAVVESKGSLFGFLSLRLACFFIIHFNFFLNSPPVSGLVSFQIVQGNDYSPKLHQKLVTHLETQQFYLRTLLSPSCVRACLHYFSTDSDIDRLIDAIEDFLQQHTS